MARSKTLCIKLTINKETFAMTIEINIHQSNNKTSVLTTIDVTIPHIKRDVKKL
jgi:hypothetical protein